MNPYTRSIQKLLAVWLVLCFMLAISCENRDEGETCFTKSSLENTAWVKQHLAGFQQQKSGPLRVVVYSYQQQQYLAFVNPALSSPMSHIFNCSGNSIVQLNIHYNEFTKHARVVEVLLEGKY